jgi:hypothetical protein
MLSRQGQSWLSSVVCVGVDSETPSAVVQAWLRAQIAAVVAEVRENERIIVDTADGAVVCFLGDPEDALFAATDLRTRLIAPPPSYAVPLPFRIGINVGPIRVMKSPDGRLNPIGDGINNAQHVMAFAEPGQILVSRSFFEVVACLSHGYAQLFHYLGLKNDERVRELPVYEVTAAGDGSGETTRVVEAPPKVSPSTEVLAYSTGWERAELTAAAIALEPYVGARARALVKEAAERATSVTQLYGALATLIPTAEGRAEFRRAHGIADAPAAAQNNRAAEESRSPASAAAPTVVVGAALLQAAETQLAAFLGPMARILVNRHAKGQPGADGFLTAVARELPVERRQAFLEAMRRVNGAS